MAFDNFYFKYTTRLDFLENSQFRFTQPNQLNDPLECYPQILMESYADEDIELASFCRETRNLLLNQRILHFFSFFS